MNQVLLVAFVASIVTAFPANIPVKDVQHRPPVVSPIEDAKQEETTSVDPNLESNIPSSLGEAAVGSIDSLLKDQQTSIAEERNNKSVTISADGKLEREVNAENSQSINTHEENHHSKTLTGEKHFYTKTTENQNQGKVVVRAESSSVGDPSLTSPKQVTLEGKHKLLLTDNLHTHKILEDNLNNKKINQEETSHLTHDLVTHHSVPDDLYRNEQKTVFTQDVVDHEKDLHSRKQLNINIHGTGGKQEEVTINGFKGENGENKNVPTSSGLLDNDGIVQKEETAQAFPIPAIYVSMPKNQGGEIEQKKVDEKLREDKEILPVIDSQKTDKSHNCNGQDHQLAEKDELHSKFHPSYKHHLEHHHYEPAHECEPKDVAKPILSVAQEPEIIKTENTQTFEEDSSKKSDTNFGLESNTGSSKKLEEKETKLEVDNVPKEEKSNGGSSVVGSPAIVKDFDTQHHVYDHHPHHDLHFKHHHAIEDCNESHDKELVHDQTPKSIVTNNEKVSKTDIGYEKMNKKHESGIQFSSDVGSVKTEEKERVGIKDEGSAAENTDIVAGLPKNNHDKSHWHSSKHHHEHDLHWDHDDGHYHYTEKNDGTSVKEDEKKILTHDHHDATYVPRKDGQSHHHDSHWNSHKDHDEINPHWHHNDDKHYQHKEEHYGGSLKQDEKIHDHHDAKYVPVKNEQSHHHDSHWHSHKDHDKVDPHWHHNNDEQYHHKEEHYGGNAKQDEKIHDHHDSKHNSVKDEHLHHHSSDWDFEKDHHNPSHHWDHDDDEMHHHYNEKHHVTHGDNVKQDDKKTAIHDHHYSKYNPVKDGHSHHYDPHSHSENYHHKYNHHWDHDDDEGHYHHNEKHHLSQGDNVRQDEKKLITHDHHDAKYHPVKDESVHHQEFQKDHHAHDHHWGYDDEEHYHYNEKHHLSDGGSLKEEKKIGLHDHRDAKYIPVTGGHPHHDEYHRHYEEIHHHPHDDYAHGPLHHLHWTEI